MHSSMCCSWGTVYNLNSTASLRYCHIPTSQGKVQNTHSTVHIALNSAQFSALQRTTFHCAHCRVHYLSVQCNVLYCSLGWSGAQQELTTATYLTAMKPATVGDTTQHYRGKKNEIRTFISLPKNVLKRQRRKEGYLGLKCGP